MRRDFLPGKVHGYQNDGPVVSFRKGGGGVSTLTSLLLFSLGGYKIANYRQDSISSEDDDCGRSLFAFEENYQTFLRKVVEMFRLKSTISWTIVLLCAATFASAWPFRRRDVFDNSVDSPDGLISHLQHLEHLLFGAPDNDTGAKVAEWHEGMDVNPEELGTYAEGDILFPISMGRNGLKADSARWIDGIVPYMISPYFNEQQRALIEEAMDDYHKFTCIKFKPYKGDESDYIRITAGNTGCWSSVGRIGGPQDVNLQVPGCVTKKGTVIHELMHAVGFLHEQSRYERDDYVTIQWQNIMGGHAGNFEKASRETTDAFGVGYDYGSVMHYSSNAFSKNGQATILPKEPSGLLGLIGEIFQGKTKAVLGQREGFSQRDIQKIRKMYKCGQRRRRFD